PEVDESGHKTGNCRSDQGKDVSLHHDVQSGESTLESFDGLGQAEDGSGNTLEHEERASGTSDGQGKRLEPCLVVLDPLAHVLKSRDDRSSDNLNNLGHCRNEHGSG